MAVSKRSVSNPKLSTFNPASPSNWSEVPATVQDALDFLVTNVGSGSGSSDLSPTDFRQGNFSLSVSQSRYTWSGTNVGLLTLPNPSLASGKSYVIKNLSMAGTSGTLIMSGTLIDYSISTQTISPQEAKTIWSDNYSWLII